MNLNGDFGHNTCREIEVAGWIIHTSQSGAIWAEPMVRSDNYPILIALTDYLADHPEIDYKKASLREQWLDMQGRFV